MDLYRLPADEAVRAMCAGPVDAGWVRAISKPRTIQQVLSDAAAEMDEMDRREAQARDPVVWARAHRPRRRLIDVLFGRR